jgi:hypothetical protein
MSAARGLVLAALLGACRTVAPPPVDPLRAEIEQRYATGHPVTCCPVPCGNALCEQNRLRVFERERQFALRYGEPALETLKRRHTDWLAQRCAGVTCPAVQELPN